MGKALGGAGGGKRVGAGCNLGFLLLGGGGGGLECKTSGAGVGLVCLRRGVTGKEGTAGVTGKAGTAGVDCKKAGVKGVTGAKVVGVSLMDGGVGLLWGSGVGLLG